MQQPLRHSSHVLHLMASEAQDLTARRGAGSANASAGDFWDVMCVSFDQGEPTRVACDKSPENGAGAVHVRYDCAKKIFWILTYVFSSYRFSDNAGDIWAVKECTEAGDQWCEANDRKFLQYDPQSEGCSGSCPSTCTTPTACWCCNDMWIIEDGNAGPVGWMAKASFDLRQNSTTSWDAMMLHFDWGGDNALGETGSSSSGAEDTANPGICFNCTSEQLSFVAIDEQGVSLTVPLPHSPKGQHTTSHLSDTSETCRQSQHHMAAPSGRVLLSAHSSCSRVPAADPVVWCTAGEPRIGPPPPPPPPVDVAVNITSNTTRSLLGSAFVYIITMCVRAASHTLHC